LLEVEPEMNHGLLVEVFIVKERVMAIESVGNSL
jgi:hypothetical protein